MAIAPRPPYCDVQDVLDRLYSGVSTGQGPTQEPQRDVVIGKLILQLSRRFDKETGRIPGNFAPIYDTRLYSGRGSMRMFVDEMVQLTKIEYNTSPGTAPTWTDITGDIALGRMTLLPLRVYPKNVIWRLNVFIPDPYHTGNIRVTGIFGACQPDISLSPPTPPWQGLTDPLVINAMSPDGLGGGWWAIDDDVVEALAEWTVYTYKANQSGYSDTAGNQAGGPLIYRKGIPPEVQMVIDSYAPKRGRVGAVTTDGVVLGEGDEYSNEDVPSRWAGWTTAPGSSFPNG